MLFSERFTYGIIKVLLMYAYVAKLFLFIFCQNEVGNKKLSKKNSFQSIIYSRFSEANLQRA